MRDNAMCARPVRWATTLAATAAGFGVLLLPAAWALRGCGPVALDGIETLDDAVAACRHTGLDGWELVTYAQRLVYRKFTHYSCRNLWDTPAQAFRRGLGYSMPRSFGHCTQYNLALKQILDRLGFETQAVFSLKVRVADDPEWAMGHTWLRVRVDGEVWDVCAGDADNLPGQVNFVPLAPVWPGRARVLFLTHLGMILFCFPGLLQNCTTACRRQELLNASTRKSRETWHPGSSTAGCWTLEPGRESYCLQCISSIQILSSLDLTSPRRWFSSRRKPYGPISKGRAWCAGW
jgi:hypothetical protein